MVTSSENRPEFKFSVKTDPSLNPSLPVQRFGPISQIILILFLIIPINHSDPLSPHLYKKNRRMPNLESHNEVEKKNLIIWEEFNKYPSYPFLMNLFLFCNSMVQHFLAF